MSLPIRARRAFTAVLFCSFFSLISAATLAAQGEGEAKPKPAAAEKQPEKPKPKWIAERDAWQKMSTSDRHAHRREIERQQLEMVKSAVAKPWRAKDGGQFLVLSNAPAKFTKAASAAAEKFFAWCDDKFDGVNDEYVRRRLLRVILDEDPDGMATISGRGARRGMTLDWDRSLKTKRDTYYGNSGVQFAGLFRDILDAYLLDKDPLLYRYMPGWLASGLTEVAGSAYMKSNKLLFREDEDERDDLRMLVRAGGVLPLRELLGADEKLYASITSGDDGERHQFTRTVRFFVFGPGRKHKRTKGFLTRYMQAVIQAVDELRSDWDADALDEKTEGTEEELAALKTARVKEWTARRDAVTKRAFELACGDWSEKDWASLQKAYAKYEGK